MKSTTIVFQLLCATSKQIMPKILYLKDFIFVLALFFNASLLLVLNKFLIKFL